MDIVDDIDRHTERCTAAEPQKITARFREPNWSSNVIDPVTAHGLATAGQERVIECDSEVTIIQIFSAF